MLIKCENCRFNFFDIDLESDSLCPGCGEDFSSVGRQKRNKPIFLQTVLPAPATANRKDIIRAEALSLANPLFFGTTSAAIVSVAVGYFFTTNITVLLILFFAILFIVGGAVEVLEGEKIENSSSIEKYLTKKLSETNKIWHKIIGKIFFKKESELLQAGNAPKWSLLGKKETAQRRIDELIERKRQINLISTKMRKTGNQESIAVSKKLNEANKIINTHIGRYKLQKQKIQLAILQNNIVPLLDSFFQFTENETKEALKQCEKAKQNLKGIKKGNNQVFEFISQDNKEMEDFENQINETKITIKKLEESLLHRKAMLAIEEVKSIEDTFDASDFGDLAHRLETFGAKSSLVDFNESFDKLESEYKRLRAENEASQKLLG